MMIKFLARQQEGPPEPLFVHDFCEETERYVGISSVAFKAWKNRPLIETYRPVRKPGYCQKFYERSM